MARRSRSGALSIWMNGLYVGQWQRAGNGTESLSYDAGWVSDPQGRPLSLSLPFSVANQPLQGSAVSFFFDNLLPDSTEIRRRLATRYRTGDIAPFDLLAAVGRDCVGALQLLPEDETPADLYTIQAEVLDEASVARLLRSATGDASLGRQEADDDLRLSIAGAQEKTALLRRKRKWLKPLGSTPTTHILKLPMGLVGNRRADMRTSVENEWLCAQLVEAYGLSVARCEIAHFEDQKALVVERFDRRLASDGRWILRLPQEDFCQATGTDPLFKYQADGGPGIARIMHLLRTSKRAEADCRHFFKTQLVFWLLAAVDGHAKNFSIHHLPGGEFQLAPLYDVLSAHPITGRGANQIAPQKLKLAMAVRGRGGDNLYLLGKIQRRHWNQMAAMLGLGADCEDLIAEVLAETPAAIALAQSRLPRAFPQDLAESIFSGLNSQARKLADMPVGKDG